MLHGALRTWPLIVAFLAAGCGGGTSGAELEVGTVVAQVTVKPDGEVVETAGGDGVEIIASPGAVAEDTILTVEMFTAAAVLDAIGVDLDVDPATEVLAFTSEHEILTPFTVRVRTEQDALDTGIDFAVFVPIALLRGRALEVAGSVRTDADDATGDVHLQFEVDPTHVLVGGREGGFYVIAESDLFVTVETTMPGQGVPPAAAVGDLVDTKIVLTCVEGGGLVPSGAGTASLDAPGWEVQGGTAGGPLQFGAGLQDHVANCLYVFGDKAKSTRTSEPQVAWRIAVDNAWNTKGGTPVLSENDLDILVKTAVALRSPPVVSLEWPESDQFSRAEALPFDVSGPAFLLGGKLGVAFPDLDAGQIPAQATSGLSDHTIGAIILNYPNLHLQRGSALAATAPTAEALVSYANSGFGIRHWVPDIDGFGATEIDPASGSVSDVDVYEEDTTRAVLVQSGRNQVRFVEYVTDPFSLPRFTVLSDLVKGISSSLFPGATGFVVSAARRSDTSPVYFVTVGATPNDPGQLWRKNDPADRIAPATLVGSVGNVPRRIRFLKSIGIVSNSFSDSLTILVRDASDNVTIKGTVDVGDGPIGIDLIELPDGNIGVLSCGFLDNTYTITVLEPDGDLVSNVTAPVPEGGQKPAGAVFANAEGTRIAVSCSGSGEVIIVPVE